MQLFIITFSQREVAGISEANEYYSSGHSIFCCWKSHRICPQSKGVNNLITVFFCDVEVASTEYRNSNLIPV